MSKRSGFDGKSVNSRKVGNPKPNRVNWDRESALIAGTLAVSIIIPVCFAFYMIANEGRGEVAVIHSQAWVYAKCLRDVSSLFGESLGRVACETFVGH